MTRYAFLQAMLVNWAMHELTVLMTFVEARQVTLCNIPIQGNLLLLSTVRCEVG